MYKIILLLGCALGAYIGWAYATHLNNMAQQRANLQNTAYYTDFEQCAIQYKDSEAAEQICLHLTGLEF